MAKDDPRTEAYGTIDEAVAALGVARAELLAAADARARPLPSVSSRCWSCDCSASCSWWGRSSPRTPAARDRLTDGVTRVSEAMLEALEATLAEHEAAIEMPREFVVPGETRASAALEVARTVMRRAERRIVTFQRDGGLVGCVAAAVRQPPGRSALDPGARRRAGRRPAGRAGPHDTQSAALALASRPDR